MTPYYERDGITIYCGDCREIIPTLPVVDLVVTDPPYQSLNVEVSTGTTTRWVGRDQFAGKRLASLEKGMWFQTLTDDEIAQTVDAARKVLKPDGAVYVFGDVKTGLKLFPNLGTRNVIVWDKINIGMGYAWRRTHEWIAYCPCEGHRLRNQAFGDIIRVPGVDDKLHATEKPVGVITPLIENSTEPGDTVLDMFAGVGSVLIAAKVMGRKAIGIEIEKRYCEKIVERLRQGLLPLTA